MKRNGNKKSQQHRETTQRERKEKKMRHTGRRHVILIEVTKKTDTEENDRSGQEWKSGVCPVLVSN